VKEEEEKEEEKKVEAPPAKTFELKDIPTVISTYSSLI
jgi:hypothetical protein